MLATETFDVLNRRNGRVQFTGHWHGDDNFTHACDTSHCRAGWVVALAGKEGWEGGRAMPRSDTAVAVDSLKDDA